MPQKRVQDRGFLREICQPSIPRIEASHPRPVYSFSIMFALKSLVTRSINLARPMAFAAKPFAFAAMDFSSKGTVKFFDPVKVSNGMQRARP
jgi:hypothetical protein